jgi:hypothetical protein
MSREAVEMTAERIVLIVLLSLIILSWALLGLCSACALVEEEESRQDGDGKIPIPPLLSP